MRMSGNRRMLPQVAVAPVGVAGLWAGRRKPSGDSVVGRGWGFRQITSQAMNIAVTSTTLSPVTMLTCAIMVESPAQALSCAVVAAEHGAELVEYRFDQLAMADAGIDAMLQTVAGSPLPCIATIRPTWEGGTYDGDEQHRISAFEHLGLADRPPTFIDIELVTWQRSANVRQKIMLAIDHPEQTRRDRPGLILSSHDFVTRPDDLLRRVADMTETSSARVCKIVWQSRSLRDSLEAFDILTNRGKPTVALCMGATGLASRVLAKKFGAMLTFACLDDAGATAPGQPTLTQIKRLYRWDHITPETQTFGVVGHPVEHSMSPPIMNAGFDATDYDGVYLPLPIPPEFEHFKATMASFIAQDNLHFRGASVTIPHKANLLRFVAEQGGEVEPLARQIGAANTLHVRSDGSLYAGNTDYAAILDSVCDTLAIQRADLAKYRVAVIGAGGAARSAVAGFAAHGSTVVIYNRTREKAHQLAADMTGSHDVGTAAGGKVVAAPLDKLCDSCAHIYVNCTPIGMWPNTDASPIDPTALKPPPDATHPLVIFDTVYNPVRTLLLQQAEQAGLLSIPGTAMFVRQAAAQFELWTGKQAPRDVFERVLLEYLEADG